MEFLKKNQQGAISPKLTIGIGLFAIIAIILALSFTSLVGWNETGKTVIVQYPNGQRMVKVTPGPFPKIFGRVIYYKQYVTVGFGSQDTDTKAANIEPVDVIFNDGAGATISGIVRVQLPTKKHEVEDLWKGYSAGFDHFVSKGIVPVVENAVRLAANLRDAQSAYTALAQFQSDVNYQLKNGTYVTESETVIDTLETGETETRQKTIIKKDKNGLPILENHVLQEIGCVITQCQIKKPEFDKTVVQAIQRRKEEALQTEIEKQMAIRAEQRGKTIIAQGKASADSVRWEVEKRKAMIVTQAEAARDSAKLMMEAAEFSKKALILQGQGEAEKKRLIMTADGALEKKLKTYIRVQEVWAQAFANGYKVPVTMIGGGGKEDENTSPWTNFMNLMNAKTAKELNVNTRPTK